MVSAGIPGGTVGDIDDVDWDEEVDVICVGPESAALAFAVAADEAGLDVLLTDSRGRDDGQTLADRLGLTGDSAEYLDCVTDDTGPLAQPTAPAKLPIRPADEPWWPGLGEGVTFSGAALRDWAAACLASPYGLLCTAVADVNAAPLRVGTIPAGAPMDIGGWLASRTRELGIMPHRRTALISMVFADGQVVGGLIDVPEGQLLVRSAGGVVLPTVPDVRPPHGAGDLDGADTGELVLLARPFSRFAQLQLWVRTTR